MPSERNYNSKAAYKFYTQVDKEIFLKVVKPAFVKAAQDPNQKNTAALIKVARMAFSPNEPKYSRTLLGHALALGTGPKEPWNHASDSAQIGFWAQDKVANERGNKNAQNALISAMEFIIKRVETNFRL